MLIYKATNLVNNKVYIGKTVTTLKRRMIQHKHDALKANTNGKFYNAIRKYGWESFSWEIVYKGTDNEDICKKEIELISLHNSIKEGYNATIGGEGMAGFLHSEETKAKVSASRKGLTAGENHPSSKLTKNDVVEIKKRLINGESQRSIAKTFNVARSTIVFIQNGTTWSDVIVEGFNPYRKGTIGEENSGAKLSEENVRSIKKMLVQGEMKQTEIAEIFGITKSVINKIRNEEAWSHVKVEGFPLEKKNKTMSSEDIIKIKGLIEEGLSLRKIALKTGFNRESVRKIKIKMQEGEI
ncbi:GIY-YIG nuclease family protein [Priestia megaterium]|uniref:GIY-YIG nuclease family protein n=1 Tax=Priestia megaterium TaxID=1404 RepID=UPI000BFC623E|nr:GIY-YIG nuclease family protein [Priestia megaterium]PGO60728.1 hypothetical protein CN981_09325 [Priestia megaterium]